jgi:uncharacterized membrane protein
MTDRRFTLLDTATVVVAVGILALALWTLTNGPTTPVPMHFGLNGQPDRYGDRTELGVLLVFMAAMTAITAGMMGWYAGRSEEQSRRRGLRMGQFISLIAIGGTTALLGWAALGGAAGATAFSPGWTIALLGLILTLIGAGLGRVGPNPLVGVRTPWSYKSRLAWDRSNRLAGRLFFWFGLILLIAGPIAPQPLTMIAAPALILVAAIWSVFESWRVWRTDPDRQPF